jgi:hypothetical protein
MSLSLWTQGHGQVVPDINGSLVYLATIAAETDFLLQYWFPVGDALSLSHALRHGCPLEATKSTPVYCLYLLQLCLLAWKIPIALETAF